jgi:hypothetical protein
MGIEFSTRDAPFQERLLHGAAAELGNAVFALFWDGEEPRLGTLTVTLPDGSSSTLLGDRDAQLGQIIGMQIASRTGKIALVSVNLPLSVGNAAGRAMLDLARSLTSGEVEAE